MSQKNIKIEDKIELRNKAKEKIISLENIFSERKYKEVIDEFKDKFSICEMGYKVILSGYNKSKNNKDGSYMKISMKTVPSAMKFANYNFENVELTKLFGANTKKGEKSVKKLRDELNHDLNEEVIAEIINRKEELYNYMNEFIDFIKKYDTNDVLI